MTADSKPYMSAGFAVFNGHLNDADKRARRVMREGSARRRRWIATVERIEREGDGIMAIFQRRYCGPRDLPAVKEYVRLVTKFVNEDRDPPQTYETE